MKYVITIGNFDGLHIGHKKIISHAVNMANDLGAKSRLITFKTHTRAIGNLILDHDDKISMIKSMNIDDIVELDFDEIKSMTPIEFMDQFFEDAVGIVVGEDFCFGKNRSGNADDLKKYGANNNISVDIVKDITDDNSKVSSSTIRELIKIGDVYKASKLLGYDFYVCSTIEDGYKRGQTLGFKTANISWPENIIKPKYGVYYTQMEIDGKIYDSMTMSGVAKTFNKDYSCETYIFNFDQDIYRKPVKLIFRDFLRENKKFDSKEELIEQLKKDKINSIETAVRLNGDV